MGKLTGIEFGRILALSRVSQDETQKTSFLEENEKRFSHLAKLARKYLCVMATPTTAERVFSAPGLLLTKRRQCEQDFVFD